MRKKLTGRDARVRRGKKKKIKRWRKETIIREGKKKVGKKAS